MLTKRLFLAAAVAVTLAGQAAVALAVQLVVVTGW
jgi:hypothetical protein